MPLPPHLPPKTCTIAFHRYVSIFKIVALSVTIGIVAGAAAALSVIAWVPALFPSFDLNPTLRPQGAASEIETPTLKEEVWNKVRAARVYFYSAQEAPKKLLTQNGDTIAAFHAGAALGSGIFITSDGWILAPTAVLGRSPTTLIGNGRILKTMQNVRDDASGLTFIKVEGDGFPVIPLTNAAEWLEEKWWSGALEAVPVPEVTWLLNDGTRPERGRLHQGNTLVTWPFVALSAPTLPGQPLIGSDGTLIGLLEKTHGAVTRLLPVPLVIPIMNDVFLHEPLERPRLPFTYYTLAEWNLVDARNQTARLSQGILIEKSDAPTLQPFLQKGDVVTAVEGIPLTNQRDPALLIATFANRENVHITLIREGRELTLPLPLGL